MLMSVQCLASVVLASARIYSDLTSVFVMTVTEGTHSADAMVCLFWCFSQQLFVNNLPCFVGD